jgi:hypothetical protein
MKTSFRQRVLIAVGISAGLLASLNLFAQSSSANQFAASTYTINSQTDYVAAVESIQTLAGTLYDAHVKYPALAYTHVYNQDGSLMGFAVTGVPLSSEADKISLNLMQLEMLGNAVHHMDFAYLPVTKDEKLSSRISRKKAMQNTAEQDAVLASIHPNDIIASTKQ